MTNCTTVPGDKVVSLRDVPEMICGWELEVLTIVVLWITATVLVVIVSVLVVTVAVLVVTVAVLMITVAALEGTVAVLEGTVAVSVFTDDGIAMLEDANGSKGRVSLEDGMLVRVGVVDVVIDGRIVVLLGHSVQITTHGR